MPTLLAGLLLEDAGVAKDYDESKHPRVPAGETGGGRFTSGGNGTSRPVRAASVRSVSGPDREAYEFFSPNEAENLTFDQALANLDTPNQRRFLQISDDIDRKTGLNGHSVSAIGDWSDGAENSVFDDIGNARSFQDVEYSAAQKGELAHQKAVIPFITDAAGSDSIYRFDLPQNVRDVRGVLDKAGLQFRTLIPAGTHTGVVIYDPGTGLKDKIEALGQKYGTDIEQYRGHGEFLGGETRADGHAAYKAVIQAWKAAHPGRNGTESGAGLPDARAQKAQAVAKGGPGSGVRGHVTPRPEGPGRPQGALADTPSDRVQRALAAYNPMTRTKRQIASESEKMLSQALGLPRTPDNSTFDLLGSAVGVEVKTLIDQKNDKITMHPESLQRKEDAIRQAGAGFKAFTVVVDKRGGPVSFYVSPGVGSFRIGNMSRVNLNQLRGMVS
jgi:hypothetical protein